jgi:hypothetical protein
VCRNRRPLRCRSELKGARCSPPQTPSCTRRSLPLYSRPGTQKGKIPTAKSAKKKAQRKADLEIAARRAKAYADMEPHLCDVVSMGTIAMDQFDKDGGLFIFAVGKLEEMLNEFRQRYYAVEFPPA